jgi:hypothetical protein
MSFTEEHGVTRRGENVGGGLIKLPASAEAQGRIGPRVGGYQLLSLDGKEVSPVPGRGSSNEGNEFKR